MGPTLTETTSSLVEVVRAERETARQLRAALLRVGCYLGLDERTVIRFSETITGRPWARCGGAEVIQIGRSLLDIAAAVRCEYRERGVPGRGPSFAEPTDVEVRLRIGGTVAVRSNTSGPIRSRGEEIVE